ncbi:MAG: sugar phosphate isomerase/epimerase family protein [Promethearchaeia archaeon]
MIIGLQTIKGFKIENILNRAIGMGFHAFEIFFDGYGCSDLSSAFQDQLVKRIEKNQVFLTVHAPIWEELNENAKQNLYDHLNFANEMKAHIFTLHPIYPLDEFSDFLDTFLSKAQNLVPELQIGIENTPMTSVNDLNSLFSQLEFPKNAGITYDIGHAQLAGDVFAYLAELRAPLFECHVHTNDGKSDDHLDIRDPQGVIPIKKILKFLVLKKEFKGPYILEYWREGIYKTYDWLLEMEDEFLSNH